MSNMADSIQATSQSAERQMERFLERADAKSIFSAPVQQGEYTAVMAAEVVVAGGFGIGAGGSEGVVTVPKGDGEEADGKEDALPGAAGGGGGGGGGGSIATRPVAAIEIGPQGVKVIPIVDPTKIALAFFTTLGAMFMFLGRMKKQAREWQA